MDCTMCGNKFDNTGFELPNLCADCFDSFQDAESAERYLLRRTDQYFIKVALDRHGMAVRDNTRDQLIAIGKAIDAGVDDEN